MRLKLIVFSIFLFISQISFSQDFKFGKVSVEELQEKSHPKEPDANAAVLYRELKTSFKYMEGKGFMVMTDVFERIKIYNREGFDWATKKVNMYQGKSSDNEVVAGLKGVTYYLNESGKIEEIKLRNEGIFEEKASKFIEVKKFTMPDIKEGCVIEYKYTLKSPFISNIETYRFQEIIPINKLEFKFSVPEYFNYKSHQKGWVFFKIEQDSKEKKFALSNSSTQRNIYGKIEQKGGARSLKYTENIYSVSLNNVSPIIEESYTGNIDNYSSSLKMELSYTKFPNSIVDYYASTWEDVSQSIYALESFGSQLKKTNYFEDDLDAFLLGVSNPQEKMIRIFEFVKNRMTWNKYNGFTVDLGVKTAYEEGTGNVADINLMLTAMFRYAGLNANPVLVSTKTHGIPVFPTRDGFNYVVSGVEDQDTVLLFDATNKDGEVNILEAKLLNWQGRIIRKDESSAWVSLAPKKHALLNTMLDVEIADDLTIQGTSKNRNTGHYAMEMRDVYGGLNVDAQRKTLESDKGEAELNNVVFENLEVLNKPIKYSYDFDASNALEKVGEKLYFSPLLFLATIENPFKLDQRKYPVDYGYIRKDRCLISIIIPEGYKVESMPENVSFGLDKEMGSFKYLISNSGNKIQLSVELAINESVIPAGNYVSLKKFFELLITKENEKVVLSKI
ncbi:MAG: hypothetical protein ACI9M9_001718 [Flavobacteriaceae bacterium]|jgi:hypothetical protein